MFLVIKTKNAQFLRTLESLLKAGFRERYMEQEDHRCIITVTAADQGYNIMLQGLYTAYTAKKLKGTRT